MREPRRKAKSSTDGKWIAGLGPSTSIVDAARRVLTIRLGVVRDAMGPALHESERDSEYVHQLRVSTRRAGAAVEIFARCLPEKTYKAVRKQLKRLRRAAGAARDWDVFLLGLTEAERKHNRRHRAGLDFLIGYTLAQRTVAQGQLTAACPEYPFAFDRFLAEVLAAIDKTPAPVQSATLFQFAAPMLSTLLTNLEQAAEVDVTDYARLHRVRIFGKRLRYAMELFADCFPAVLRNELYPAVEEMQEILGRANDSYVASQRLQALSAKLQAVRPADWQRFRLGIEGLLHFHARRLPEERQHFLDWWQRWQRSGRRAALAHLLGNVEAAAS